MRRFFVGVFMLSAIHPALALVFAVGEVVYMAVLIAKDERSYRRRSSIT
jgi:hypothetical protein